MNQSFGISGIFMIIFLTASAFLSCAAVWQGRVDAPALKPVDVVTGKWTPSYEHVFNKKLYTYDASKDGWGALNFAAFHEGSKGVLVGANNWLFTSEEFDHPKAQQEKIQKNLAYIHTVHNHLAEKGIALVIVPVPAKARVYRDQLGRYKFPSYKQDIYQSLLDDMSGHKIAIVDTMRALEKLKAGKEAFLRTDTHWTPEGAQAAAQATAEYIRAMPISFSPGEYHSLLQKEETHSGDLLRYIPVGGFSSHLNIPVDRLDIFETVETGMEPASGDSDALFSEKTPPVTLVGTSYSANPKWNFAGFLKENLRTDVLNAADEGLGPFETMHKYLKNEAFLESPPKLVIWEIPERYLSFDYNLPTDFLMDRA